MNLMICSFACPTVSETVAAAKPTAELPALEFLESLSRPELFVTSDVFRSEGALTRTRSEAESTEATRITSGRKAVGVDEGMRNNYCTIENEHRAGSDC
ncbi:hypothetical protein MPTK1_3g17290 [Marchantia polymorpha subsp. ruderalis]|uniref:Uncharacterized protein n=2 Tax=Marchantia polymorpha TaxID=3197 RepID=A0AAF6B1R8_MARPO|nr:hypothetical protein MARPO_0039s0065 [Marchantia polymorpha]BBN05952.1 hypothetical protein Mp_3g17290 [Marchantia polymorpha subsp. ruderalis]|eukprot:PTQ40572.1 hypothetical protein MARPO_0039s0065 [Marchantia polymorpha]